MEKPHLQNDTQPELVPKLDTEFMQEVASEYKKGINYVEEGFETISKTIETIGYNDLIPEKVKKMLLILQGELNTTHFENKKYKLKPYFKTNDISKEDYKENLSDDLEFLKRFTQICVWFNKKEYINACAVIKTLEEFSVFTNFKKTYPNIPSEHEIEELRALYIIMEKLKKDPNIEALKNRATKEGPNDRVAEEILKSFFNISKNI